MDKIVKVNQEYNLRNGKTAKINSDVRDIGLLDEYRFGGDVYNEDGTKSRLAYWTPDGRYNLSKQSEFDIVSERE